MKRVFSETDVNVKEISHDEPPFLRLQDDPLPNPISIECLLLNQRFYVIPRRNCLDISLPTEI